MTKADALIQKFRALNVWKRADERAPHKPLLILLALGRVQRGQPRLISFSEIVDPLTELLKDFGPARRSYHPEYPFWRLQADGLWQLEEQQALKRRKGNTDPF